MKLRRILITASMLTTTVFTACGPGEEELEDSQTQTDSGSTTAYGSSVEVSQYLGSIDPLYLGSIDPFIQRIGATQAEVDKVLGTAGKGTGENLAPAADVARKQLNLLMEEFNAVTPPPLLAPFHRDTKKLIALRLQAYTATIDGWKLEQEGAREEYRSYYDEAQNHYKEANEVIIGLNGQMEKINEALQTAGS